MAKKKATKTGTKFIKRRDGRYTVQVGGKTVNGEEKAKLLAEKGLIKLTAPSKKEEEAPAEETAAEETSE